jgi:hypothetical protein
MGEIEGWKEFGPARTDDFSPLHGDPTRVFTLDDGVTTLLGVERKKTLWEKIKDMFRRKHYITFTFKGLNEKEK